MRVLVGCEFSGIVRDAFIERGHDAVSCDIRPTESPGPHYQGNILDLLGLDWDLAIFHPPCTFLSNAGSKHLYIGGVKSRGWDYQRVADMIDGAMFFRTLLDAPIPRIAVENPVMHGYAKNLVGRGYDQKFHPYDHGHKELKSVCLWLKNLPKLHKTIDVGPPPKCREERKAWEKVWRMPPGPEREKERSKFFRGVAIAMADQWGTIQD